MVIGRSFKVFYNGKWCNIFQWMPEVKSKVGQLEIGGHKKGLNAPGCCTCWNSDDNTECAIFGEDFQVLLNVLCETFSWKN